MTAFHGSAFSCPLAANELSGIGQKDVLSVGATRRAGQVMNGVDTAVQRPLAVVTAAGSGIGLALAGELARQGYDLVVAGENESIGDAANRLSADGAVVYTVCADLATFDGVEELAASTRATGRPVAALVLNTGFAAGGDVTRETSLETDLRMIALNCAGSVHLAKRVLPGMVERGAGRVLFTSSIAAAPGPFHAVYASSNAFVARLSQAWREELRASGVTVTAFMPGSSSDDPDDVAHEAVVALLAAKERVIPGS